jgi:hypothetical protein
MPLFDPSILSTPSGLAARTRLREALADMALEDALQAVTARRARKSIGRAAQVPNALRSRRPAPTAAREVLT